MRFSERESLLLEVLREAGRPMVGAELADLLGVSRRTVRYDIGRINRLRGSALVNSDRAGYSLNLDAYRGVLRDAPWAASVLDDDERLLVHLLDHEERGLYDAATECYLGESAVRSAVTRLAPHRRHVDHSPSRPPSLRAVGLSGGRRLRKRGAKRP